MLKKALIIVFVALILLVIVLGLIMAFAPSRIVSIGTSGDAGVIINSKDGLSSAIKIIESDYPSNTPPVNVEVSTGTIPTTSTAKVFKDIQVDGKSKRIFACEWEKKTVWTLKFLVDTTGYYVVTNPEGYTNELNSSFVLCLVNMFLEDLPPGGDSGEKILSLRKSILESLSKNRDWHILRFKQ